MCATHTHGSCTHNTPILLRCYSCVPIPSAESHDHDVIIKSSDIEQITVCHSKTIPTMEIALATGDVSGIVCICGMYTHMIQIV